MKSKIEFYGSSEIIKQLESAGADVEKEIINAIRKSAVKPSNEMLGFIRQHKRSGRTEDSFTEEIKSKDGVITAEFGFSVRKGGLASIFFETGTPRQAPPAYFFISNAVDNSIDEIIAEQNKALLESFRSLTK